tara:strand:- start:405 stop:1256 length:852 start_codon:yes stop_codon:yes gene_type:complete
MKVLDLFSGIGGFSLGLEWAGMETVAMCEKDKFCRQVLAKHWPDITIHEDIRDLNGKDYKGSIDVVCGGFPCQPFSVAGKQLGKADDRHLWPEMLRVIKESAPAWVIGENVSGFVGMALDDVCSDLEGEGYRVQSFIIPACAVEAHHRRDRCWVVAYSNENDRRRRDSTISQERHTWMEHRSGGQGQSLDGSDSDVAYSESERVQRLRSCGLEESHAHGPALLPLCEGKGFGSTYWETEPDVDRVVDGVPNRVDRIKSLGNAVVPQLVQRIGEMIYAEHQRCG